MSELQEVSTEQAIGILAQKLADYFPSKQEFDKQFADIRSRIERKASEPVKFSISKAVRGLAAEAGRVLNYDTKDEDIAYAHENLERTQVKALTTGSTPGSYLVPTLQAAEIIAMLTDAGALRQFGPRIWPMANIQNINIPTATATPTVEWIGENTAQNASDPTFGQVPLSLKTARALIAIPNELLAVSTPAVDVAVTELLAIGFATKEDSSFFSTASQSGGPTSVYAAANTSKFLVGGTANGGNLAYSDVLATLDKAYTVAAQPPFKWVMHPRTFFQRLFGLIDLQSRPIVTQDVGDGFSFRLFGYPVVISTQIPIVQTNGSGTAQSYILLTNPNYVHVGDSGSLEIAFSAERYFDANQTAVRGVRRLDYGYGPPAGIVILQGVN